MKIHRKSVNYINCVSCRLSNRNKNFLLLFMVGVFLVFTGIIVLLIAALLSGGQVNFGAIIFIGPFPIVVGAGREAVWMILLAVFITILSIIMFIILRRKA